MKRKIFLTILLIAFAIFATIAFAACDRNGDYPLYDETYQLSVPQNFTINTQTGIATWGEVENARTFTIRSGDFTAISDTNSFYMGDLRLTPGTHVVSVRADGRIENLVRYIESGFSDEATFVKAEPAGTRIYNQVQLVALLNNSSGTFVLGNDIVLTYQIPPIENFTGTLDGANRSIIGLTFTGNHQHAGLFGVVRNGKTVRNLNLDNFNFNIDATSQVFAGALISRIELDYARDISINIENVFVRGLNINATSSTSDAYAGGLIGSVWTGLFTNHAKPININSSRVYDSTISATSLASGSSAFVGGAVAFAYILTPFALINRHSSMTINNTQIDAILRAYGANGAYAGGVIGFFRAHNNQHSFYPHRRRPEVHGVLNFLMMDRVVANGSVHSQARVAYSGGIIGKTLLYFDTNTELTRLTNNASVTASTTVTNSFLIGASHVYGLTFIGQFDDTAFFTIENFTNNTANLTNYRIIFFEDESIYID